MEKTENELIAEFMGMKFIDQAGGFYESDQPSGAWTKHSMKYDTSWDWLMPVVHHIYKLYDEFNFTSIAQENMFLHVLDNPIKYPIHVIYKDVVEFIKWYNSQKS